MPFFSLPLFFSFLITTEKGAGNFFFYISHPLAMNPLGAVFVCLRVDLCLFGCSVSEGTGVVSHPSGKLSKRNGQTRLYQQF